MNDFHQLASAVGIREDEYTPFKFLTNTSAIMTDIDSEYLEIYLEDTDEHGRQQLVLYCPKDEQEHTVTIVEPTAERISVIQNELAALLFGGGDSLLEPEPGETAAHGEQDAADAQLSSDPRVHDSLEKTDDS